MFSSTVFLWIEDVLCPPEMITVALIIFSYALRFRSSDFDKFSMDGWAGFLFSISFDKSPTKIFTGFS